MAYCNPKEESPILGSGNSEDPMIYWRTSIPKLRARKEGCENIVRETAKKLNFTHIWIRQLNHRTTRAMGYGGRRTTIPADEHITVFLGDSPTNIKLEGHIYVVSDGSGVPKRTMRCQERQIPINGVNPELYNYASRKPKAGDNLIPRVR